MMTKHKYLISVNCSDGRERTRELVRMRDKHKCQDCGFRRFTTSVVRYNKKLKTLKGKKKSLDIHHLNGLCGKKSKSYDKVEDIQNLITLCHKCHYNRPEHKSNKKTPQLKDIMSI